MGTSRTFPLVRGRKMRVTRLDGCGRPVYGPCSQVVTEGFISVGLSAVINEGEAITVTTANGKTCVNDQPTPEFQGYTAEISFCDVDPALFSLITGQEQVLDAAGNVVGFRMNTEVDLSGSGFALEVWAGVPGVTCDPNAAATAGDPSGYLLLPYLKGGVLGDFTIENAAVTFAITGAATKGGAGWGVGPYNVQGAPAAPLIKPITKGDHLHVQYTEISPPASTEGCYPLLESSDAPVTAITPVVTNSSVSLTITPNPSTAEPAVIEWGDGAFDYVTSAGPHAHTYAAAGEYTIEVARGPAKVAQAVVATAPIPATGVAAQAAPAAFTPAGAVAPANLAALIAAGISPTGAGNTAAWTAGNHVVLGDGTHAHWDGTDWVTGDAP